MALGLRKASSPSMAPTWPHGRPGCSWGRTHLERCRARHLDNAVNNAADQLCGFGFRNCVEKGAERREEIRQRLRVALLDVELA